MAIGPVPIPLMPGAMDAFTAQMAGMTAEQAYERYMTEEYAGGNDLKIGYTTRTESTPAITGDTSNTIASNTNSDPVDAWHDYVENESADVSGTTGGIVSGSNASTIALSIMEKTDLSAEAVVPVAIPIDAAIVAVSQAVGVSIDAAQLDVETKQKFANSIVQSTGMIYDKVKDLVLAWKDSLGNILFPKSVVDAVNDTIESEGIGDARVATGEVTWESKYPGVVVNVGPISVVYYGHTYTLGFLGAETEFEFIDSNGTGTIITSQRPSAVGEYKDGGYYGSRNPYSATVGGKTYYYGGGGWTSVSPSATSWTPEKSNTSNIWTIIDILYNSGNAPSPHYWPEGTSESKAPSYDTSDLPTNGNILGANGASIPVTAINIPDDPYNSTDSTVDPTSPTDDENAGVIYPGLPGTVPDDDSPTGEQEKESPIPLPIPDTNVSNPDVPLTDPSVVNSTLINELVDELANTLDPQPGQSSGIIPIPPMPGIIDPVTGDSSFPSIVPASGSGFIHVYNPTPGEFVSFGNWLWVTYADATIDKIWNNPFDGVIGAHELYATPNRDGSDNIRSGFLTCPTTAALVRNRYSEIDCGTIIVPEFYGNYLDYSPYSQAYIYLPFIGINEVSIDDIVGHAVNVRYRVDSYTGSCIAMIFVAKDGYQNLCYQFAGSCSVEVPLAGGSQAAIKAGVLQAEAYARSSLASAALSGAQAIGAGLGTGGLAGGLMGGLSALGGMAGAWYGGKQSVEAARVANKSSVQHSGQFGASHGAMGEKIPFIIIRNPVQVKVVNYNDEYGYPAHKRVIIGGCTGFLRVREVNVISAHATDAEKAAIEAALKNGVYVS